MKSFKLKKSLLLMAVFAVSIMFVLPVISCFTDDDKKDAPATNSIVGIWEQMTIAENGILVPLGSDSVQMDCNGGGNDLTYTKFNKYSRFTADGKSYDYFQVTNVNIINVGACSSVPVNNAWYYCIANGDTYVVEGNKIIFNKGTVDEDSINFTISGDTMTASWTEGADAYVLTFARRTEAAVATATSGCAFDY